jgi:hypothetical protein
MLVGILQQDAGFRQDRRMARRELRAVLGLSTTPE